MLKTLIEEQKNKLNEYQASIDDVINKKNHEIEMLRNSYEKQKEEFDKMVGLSNDKKSEFIKKLNTFFDDKIDELGNERDELNNQIDNIKNEMKDKLKDELNKTLKKVEETLKSKKQVYDDIDKKLIIAIESGEFDLMSDLRAEMEGVLSSIVKLEKINNDLCDIISKFDGSSYEELVAEINKIENLSLVDDLKENKLIEDLYKSVLDQLSKKMEELNNLLNDNYENIIKSDEDMKEINTSVANLCISIADDKEKQEKLLTTREELERIYISYEELKNAIDAITNQINELNENNINQLLPNIQSNISKIKNQKVKEYLEQQCKKAQEKINNSQNNPGADDYKKTLNDFYEEYENLENLIAKNENVSFDKIEKLASIIQFMTSDEIVKKGTDTAIQNTKNLKTLVTEVYDKLGNKITSEAEKEIEILLEKINGISKKTYDYVNGQFKKALEDKNKNGANSTNVDEKIIAFFNNIDQTKNETNNNDNYDMATLTKIINDAYLDDFEEVSKKVEKLTKSDEKIALSLLIQKRIDQLKKIKDISDNLSADADRIDLEHYSDNEYVKKLVEVLEKYVISINNIYTVIKDAPTDSVVVKKYDSLVDAFVKFNNKAAIKFNIEKYRVKPTSKQFNYKENGRIHIARLNKKSLKENGLKELFANTTKILKAKDAISAIKWKIRTEGLDGLSNRERKEYDKAVRDISEDLFIMLEKEVERLEKGEFSLRPVVAFDAWTLLLSIMPADIQVEKDYYTIGYVTELVTKYINLITNKLCFKNDESIKRQLNKSDDLDVDECYSTIAGICLYRKENEYFEFKDNSSKDDDETLFANSYTVLYGIKYFDPKSKVKDYINEAGTTYVHKPI